MPTRSVVDEQLGADELSADLGLEATWHSGAGARRRVRGRGRAIVGQQISVAGARTIVSQAGGGRMATAADSADDGDT